MRMGGSGLSLRRDDETKMMIMIHQPIRDWECCLILYS
jgi:hypothetical protein